MNLDSDKSSFISFFLWNTKSFGKKRTSPIVYLISFSSKTGEKHTSLVFSIPPPPAPRKSGLISSGKLDSSLLYGLLPKPEISVTTPLMPWQFWFWFSVSGAGFSSVQFSSVQSLSHVWLFATPWLQHARPPCPSPTPRVDSNSCPLSRWCHPTISSSAILFSSHLQSFPVSGSFQMSQFFTSGGQSIGVSTST